MLTQVVLQTSNPMTFNIDAVNPDEILVLKSISGLTPSDVTLFTGDFARDGGYYQGRRVGTRNPVMTFKLNPDYANNIEVSDLREMLYQQFYEPAALSDGVQVTLKDDRRPDRYFVGYTEKSVGDVFSQSTDMQFSMICVDPYIKSVNSTTQSDANGWTSLPITYDGSADTGLDLTLKVKTACTQITVDLNGQQMILTGSFAVNDVVHINTVIGTRAIQKNGVDIMVAMTAASVWPVFNQKASTLKVYSTAVNDGKVVATSYTFQSKWWGV